MAPEMDAATWRLLRFNGMDPVDTQVVYHAVGKAVAERVAPPTLIICWPSASAPTGLACVGFHQDLEQEIDVEYCRHHGIPIVRRILGGGAVYLDSGQIFYQVMAPRALLPPTTGELFAHVLQAPVQTYREIGVPAVYAPVNDIRTEAGQKISGNGMGYVKDVAVITGNLIEDFPFETMGNVIKVPDEKFRDKAIQTMKQYMGTITALVADPPPRDHVVDRLVANFNEVLGEHLEPGTLTARERELMARTRARYQTREWLYQTKYEKLEWRADLRRLKIRGEVHLLQANYKSPGGLIRVTVLEEEGRITEISLSGDFHLSPRESLVHLVDALKGCPLDEEVLLRTLTRVFEAHAIDAPGTPPAEFTRAILQASG